jgi:hypothetical protein
MSEGELFVVEAGYVGVCVDVVSENSRVVVKLRSGEVAAHKRNERAEARQSDWVDAVSGIE